MAVVRLSIVFKPLMRVKLTGHANLGSWGVI